MNLEISGTPKTTTATMVMTTTAPTGAAFEGHGPTLMAWLAPILVLLLLILLVLLTAYRRWWRLERRRGGGRTGAAAAAAAAATTCGCDGDDDDDDAEVARHGKSMVAMTPVALTKKILQHERFATNPDYWSSSTSSVHSDAAAGELQSFVIIQPESIRLIHEIGEGCFGKVYKGQLFSPFSEPSSHPALDPPPPISSHLSRGGGVIREVECLLVAIKRRRYQE